MEQLKKAYWYYGTYKSIMHAQDKFFGKGPIENYWQKGMSDLEKTGAILAAGQLMRIAAGGIFNSDTTAKRQLFFAVDTDGGVVGLYRLRKLQMLLNQ